MKFWGWGYEDEVVPAREIDWLESVWSKRFGVSGFPNVPAPRAEEIVLPKPRVKIPDTLAALCTTEHYERVLH
ncbi:MAG: FAD-binding oxidoreductase, partial [Candidimonas sp.]